MEIVLATRNKKKIEEIRRITAGLPITILSLADYPHCPETVEDRDTFEGNAIKKAVEVCHCTGKPALADDSGLEVDALNGAPGVYSARYAGAGANDVRNNEKLLAELENVPAEKQDSPVRLLHGPGPSRRHGQDFFRVCERPYQAGT